ncbi:hypothetical protein QE152_g8835 [Popillia japonica]|uniref:Uncharacterized protein n=1 Tax=Popillia japonica TaxID=7064 RepID=A0AAW1M113_POPJA
MQDELLLDKIIVSINDLNISQKLWSDKKITLADAIDSIRLAELSKKQMRSEEVNLLKHTGKKNWKGNKSKNKEWTCWFCALKHEKGQCPAKGQKCHKCGKLNHFAVVCKVKKRSVSNTRGKKREQDVRQIETEQLSDEYIYTISHKSSNLSMNLTFEVDGLYKDITCQLDTGATCNVMGIENYRKITTIDKIRKSNIQLKCFGVNEITEDGLQNERKKVEEIVKNYKDVFTGIGKLKKEVSLVVNEEIVPKVQNPRRIPIALRNDFKSTLNDLEQKGIIRKVDEGTPWTSNVVLVEKKDSKLRVCIDPLELNRALRRSNYQIPTIDEILPELKEAKGVESIADNFLVYGRGKTMEEAIDNHNENIENLFKRLRTVGMTLNPNKTKLLQTEVSYYGHLLTSQGLQADPAKITTIKKMAVPTNKKELQCFLGMVNYLNKFLPNLSTVSEPLRLLTHEKSLCDWTSEHD